MAFGERRHMSDQPPVGKQNRSIATYAWLAALSALAAFAAVYVTLGTPDNQSLPQKPSGPGAEAPAPTVKTGAHPLATGAMTTFLFKPQPEALPDIRFLNGSGAEVSLAGFRGKVVLLNVWATWCAPCREEMPALDRLQAALGSDKFQVVALAVDKSGVDGARKFLADIKTEKLEAFADPTAKEGTQLKVIGMPTSILIDTQGREIGRLIGPAHWDSPEAKRLIEAQL
jgi:thiol-disulfide isomerase/thioredoxin